MASLTNKSSAPKAGIPLGSGQIAMSALLGAVLWFLAAMLLRILGPMGVYDGTAQIILYVLIVPGTVPFVFIIQKLAKLARDQIALGIAVATATAALLDGVALAWFPSLYGTEIEYIAGAGAAILWGAGVVLVLGCLINKMDRP